MLPDLTSAIPKRSLTKEEINEAALELLSAAVSDDLKADFLRAWAVRGETAWELATCAEAFLPHALNPGVQGSYKGKALLDCCGTGGGALNLINISTGLMFILAALGIPVVKHGNRGITKKSGSADVLEALGIKIDLAPGKVSQGLDEVGCAFLFAPAYHTSFATIAPVRRSLAEQGQRTIFNLLGPLLNPARPDTRIVGVFKKEHLPLYHQALVHLGCRVFSVVCGEDAESQKMIGEVSAQGLTEISSNLPSLHKRPPEIDRNRSLFSLEINPAETPIKLETMLVTDAADSARRLTAILANKDQGLGRDTLLLNAALASLTHGTASSLEEGLAQSTEALDSGKALTHLKRWQDFSKKT